MSLAVLNADLKDQHSTDILSISWTYADHTKAAKMPYTVPMDIAGIDHTTLSDEGKLSDWIRIENNTATGGFTIIVFNARDFFTLTSEMSFGEYINVIKG
jgi:hypothetical protein|tara:strand:+ start:1174 stop:1473 length:300 start_codon:yes stop_codon:yes gene_type:complete